jgi:small subunit ribosomal protein S20
MPNKKSAAKRVLIAERNRVYNRFWKTRCKTVTKRVLEAVEQGDLELARKRFDLAQGVFDKASVKGVIHRNTAARRKARLAVRIGALAAPSTTPA